MDALSCVGLPSELWNDHLEVIVPCPRLDVIGNRPGRSVAIRFLNSSLLTQNTPT